jgi:methionyl-tRNA synthetase
MTKVLTAVAWPYANGPRHLGHVAGFGVPSDVFSRYMRMAGHEVLMVSGSDEHGTPILVLADKEGVTAREFVDVNHAIIAHELADLGCSYDLYTRTTTATTTPSRRRCSRPGGATATWSNAPHSGAISVDRAHAARPLHRGHLPDLRYAEARGDQCDNCGNQLGPDRPDRAALQDQRRDPEFIETQHFFLDLPALADA